VDDYTREAIARAFQVELEFHPQLWEQIQERFARFSLKPSENNRRQALLPVGAVGIENPVGTAPAFRVERGDRVVIALPGVPAELQFLLQSVVIPYLRQAYGLTGVIKSRTIRTAGVGESWLDERIGDLERMTNPTVGLAAHPGRVDIRITSKADSEAAADERLLEVEIILRERLTDRIYGIDAQTLEASALRMVAHAGWKLAVVESGTGGALTAALAGLGEAGLAGGEVLSEASLAEASRPALDRLQEHTGAQVGLVLQLRRSGDQHEIEIDLRWPGGSEQWRRTYGGAPANATDWAVSLALDFIRRHMPTSQP